MFAALLVLGMRSQGDPLARRVTFSHVAERAEQLLPQLSSKTGVRLDFTLQTRDEILLVSVKDVTLSDLMAKIADVADARWVKLEDGYRLERPIEMRKADEAKHYQIKLDRITRALQVKRYQVAKLARFDEEEARRDARVLSDLVRDWPKTGNPSDALLQRSRQSGGSTPLSRFMARVLASLDPSDLAKLPESRRAVLCTTPNRMQLPLNLEPQIVRQYQAEQVLWRQVAKPIFDAENPDYRSQAVNFDIDPRPITTLRLAVYPNYSGKHLFLKLTATDAGGKPQSFGYEQIEPPADTPAEPVVSSSKDAPIDAKWSPTTKFMRERFFAYNANRQRIGVPTDVAGLLLKPVDHDPLSFACSELLIGYATDRNENLVADPTDQCLAPLANVRPSGLKNLFAGFDATLNESDGWLTVKAEDPFAARRDRADRRNLQQFLDTASIEGRVSLDASSLYYANEDPDCYDLWFGKFAHLFGGRYLAMFPDELRFFAELTPDQRKVAMRNGKAQGANRISVSLGSLTPRQSQVLERLIYNEYLDLTQASAGPPSGIIRGSPTDPGEEPTELLPNGVPKSGLLTITETSSDVVYPLDGNPDTEMVADPRSADSLAYDLFVQERPDLFGTPEYSLKSSDFSHAVFGQETRWAFDFALAPGITTTLILQDDNLPTKTSFNDLPAPFKDALNKALKEEREKYRNAKPGQFKPRQGPPPPPLG